MLWLNIHRLLECGPRKKEYQFFITIIYCAIFPLKPTSNEILLEQMLLWKTKIHTFALSGVLMCVYLSKRKIVSML